MFIIHCNEYDYVGNAKVLKYHLVWIQDCYALLLKYYHYHKNIYFYVRIMLYIEAFEPINIKYNRTVLSYHAKIN